MSGVDDNFWPKRIGKDNGIEKGSWDKTTVSNFQQLPDRKKPPQLTLCWKLAGGQLVFQPFFFEAAPIHSKDTNLSSKKDQTIRNSGIYLLPFVDVYIIAELLIITFLT